MHQENAYYLRGETLMFEIYTKCPSCVSGKRMELSGDRLVCTSCDLHFQRECAICKDPVLQPRLAEGRGTCSVSCGRERQAIPLTTIYHNKLARRRQEEEDSIPVSDFARRLALGFTLMEDDFSPDDLEDDDVWNSQEHS